MRERGRDMRIIIAGAGPAGLSLAASLAGRGLSITIVDPQPLRALEEPACDGREIALTHRSVRILRDLGAWDALSAEAAPLREARVLNGRSPFALTFAPRKRIEELLGWLVPNHAIRRALFRAAFARGDIELIGGTGVASIDVEERGVRVGLDNGSDLQAELLVAADSRMSGTRAKLGIGADIHPLGRAMLVCRMEHEADHGRVATEWFDHRQTLALLPLNGGVSSAVITLPTHEAETLAALPEGMFNREMTRRFAARLGAMRLTGTRHLYPLTVTWSHRFVAARAALIGDAAVGMHPVTAHGFNLGLLGQHVLAGQIVRAKEAGADIGGDAPLRRYELRHRLASRPIYDATNALVRLYTSEGAAAWMARHATLRLGHRLPFARRAVGAMLAQR